MRKNWTDEMKEDLWHHASRSGITAAAAVLKITPKVAWMMLARLGYKHRQHTACQEIAIRELRHTMGQKSIAKATGLSPDAIRRYLRRHRLKCKRDLKEVKPMLESAHRRPKWTYPVGKITQRAGRPWIRTEHSWMPLSRHVASKELGRDLTPNEKVLHLDGDSSNCDPTNLKVMTQAEWMRLVRSPSAGHTKGARIKQTMTRMEKSGTADSESRARLRKKLKHEEKEQARQQAAAEKKKENDRKVIEKEKMRRKRREAEREAVRRSLLMLNDGKTLDPSLSTKARVGKVPIQVNAKTIVYVKIERADAFLRDNPNSKRIFHETI